MRAVIASVERVLAGGAGGAVRDFAIDFPRVGACEGELVRVCGWVLGAEKVAVVGEGVEVRVAEVNRERGDVAGHFRGKGEEVKGRCGFEVFILAEELPRAFEVGVEAVLEDGGRVRLAVIRGEHEGAVVGAGMQPLMVTSLGRTGTTMLMRMLGEHPAVAVERVYPYETKAATYWMHMWRALAVPAEEKAVELFEWGEWGRPPLLAAPEESSGALHGFVRAGYAGLAGMFGRAAIETFYWWVAVGQGKRGATYFCEKMLPTSVQEMFWNSYAGAKEIVLVRDFRDVFCSALAFNAKRGAVGFGRERVESDAAYVKELAKGARRLAAACRGRGGGRGMAHVVRYEALVLRPRETVRGILRYLGAEGSEEMVRRMVSAAEGGEMAGHRTAPSARASIGRWERELSGEMREMCRREFDGVLEEVGYELGADGELKLPEGEAGVAE